MGSRVKICGLRRPCDIEAVNAAKPDYIGFVFAKSRRQVSAEQAKRLKEMLNPEICAVGVFVNERPEVIAGLVGDGTIDMVQLHGQEDEAYLCRLRKLLAAAEGRSAAGAGEADCPDEAARRFCPIIRAFSVKSAADVEAACQSSADFILLDHGAGGTGQRFDWELARKVERPFFLAGGLGPENVEQACRVGAFALDMSSGVETDGFKDREKITDCVNKIRFAARAAE